MVEGKLWEVEITTMNGECKKIWGYGIPEIMETPDPVDKQGVREMFKHVPDEVFITLKKKPVDLLIGINKLSLHPSGGQGRNSVGNLKMYHSKFGAGQIPRKKPN